MTSLWNTNLYLCEGDGSLQSVCRENNVCPVNGRCRRDSAYYQSMQTKYQQTRKKHSEVVSLRSAVPNPSIQQASFSPVPACSLDAFVIAKPSRKRRSRPLLHKLALLRCSVSLVYVLWGVDIIWQGCGQSITLSFCENKNRENLF